MTVVLGLLLGAVGGAGHLAVTWQRARLGVSGASGLALLTWPLGLLFPAAAVLIAAQVAPEAAWCVPIGLFATRALVLGAAR